MPPALQEIVDFFENLPEHERREALVTYAESARRHEPRENERYDVADERKDEICLDSVGIFLRLDGDSAIFRVRLGPKVQTLTRALTSILCQGFNRQPPAKLEAVGDDFIPRIVGGELMRLRSRTVYYVLQRMREAAAKVTAST